MDDTAIAEIFAANLAHYRAQADLTIEALAARSEIHRSQVSEYLGGRSLPKVGPLARLAGALGISPADLMEGITFEPASAQGAYKIAAPKRPKK